MQVNLQQTVKVRRIDFLASKRAEVQNQYSTTVPIINMLLIHEAKRKPAAQKNGASGAAGWLSNLQEQQPLRGRFLAYHVCMAAKWKFVRARAMRPCEWRQFSGACATGGGAKNRVWLKGKSRSAAVK